MVSTQVNEEPLKDILITIITHNLAVLITKFG